MRPFCSVVLALAHVTNSRLGDIMRYKINAKLDVVSMLFAKSIVG